ncbi:hypothetical protein [Streptomyces cupreus]|uniref:Uncharacterized protein n=1 Tax=Streptomyces cupreus TaxID=2759956 RepID=A0A7X1J3U5_9ACTN|nr:hypothetical protein [Streptomyces cupreus]MBC2903154.1 hypothetical protein [Streptomyces cupreus]
MDTTTLAATVVIGAALVLAPIAPQPIRALNTPLPTPEPEPVIEPAIVANYDHYGTLWGHDAVTKTEADLAQARAQGHAIDEWNVTDRNGNPLRIVRTTDPTSTFLGGIDISVIPVDDAATTPEPEILETVPANGCLLGYDRFAITPGAPLPDGRTIATVEDPLGSCWRVTDDQDAVHYLHRYGQLIRYTSGVVAFIEPEWAGWSSD